MTVTVRQGEAQLRGLSRDVLVVPEARHPMHEAFASGPDASDSPGNLLDLE